MVYKKGVGLLCNGCDFNLKYFGVKIFGGQVIDVGNIIVCQCGIQFYLGFGVGLGCDYILFVLIDGKVEFLVKGLKKCCIVSVVVEV